ncbi:hypothetical protein BMO94_004456, partial [Shigella sonnei]|nr:hypothetical protein [Shigella sonnei]
MFGIDAQRIAAFAKSPLDNPLSRSEQMELARLFLHIQKQADIFNNMSNQPILDGHIQMVINSHEKGWAAIVPCTITYRLAKEVQEFRKASVESESTKAAINTLIRMGFTWTGG